MDYNNVNRWYNIGDNTIMGLYRFIYVSTITATIKPYMNT